MIIIKLSKNGTIIYNDGTGQELYKTDSTEELILYCLGLKKGFPDLEFEFQNDIATEAIFRAGEIDGKDLKKESARYQTVWSEGRLESCLTSRSKSKNLTEALKDCELNKAKSASESYILIDTKNMTVEIIKGTIDPFRKILDKLFSGWKIGKIEKQ